MTDATNKTGDGGPAFPMRERTVRIDCNGCREVEHGSPGMSLRDWFAGQALAGVLTTKVIATAHKDGGKSGLDGFEVAAILAYGYADAMLAERAKVTP